MEYFIYSKRGNMMLNRKLKARIIYKYGTQEDFAAQLGIRSTLVSAVVRGRRSLSDHKQWEWASVLGCKPKDVFPSDDETALL